jgi:hypothetical protein
MSTRCDVDCGDGHYLHARIFDPGKVYLELTGAGVEFEARPGRVTVAIPADVWERIRSHGIDEFRQHWTLHDEPEVTGGDPIEEINDGR